VREQVFLKKLFCTPDEIEEFIKLADSDQSGEVSSVLVNTQTEITF
jgi:hypothetical protein